MKCDQRTIADLPFNPETMDIVCCRTPTGENDLCGDPMTRVSCNISQALVSHSPTGFEWGYSGSGPSDLALNILHLFLPPHAHTADCWDEEGLLCNLNVKCYDGECSREAWALHHEFKSRFIAALPKEGGTIRGDEIRAWLKNYTTKGVDE